MRPRSCEKTGREFPCFRHDWESIRILFVQMRPMQLDILPCQGVWREETVLETVSEQKTPEEGSDAPYAAEQSSLSRGLERRDGTEIERKN